MRAVSHQQKGFTFLEIAVVLAIATLLAVIFSTSLTEGRAKIRDAERVKTAQELRMAIEQYHSEYGYYPPLSVATSDGESKNTGVTCIDGTTGDHNWCDLMAAIAPYHTGSVDDPISSDIYSYYYDADGAHPQYYGLMVMLESPSNTMLADHDGGQYCSTCSGSKKFLGYELGNEPAYCAQTTPGSNWRTGGAGVLCGE